MLLVLQGAGGAEIQSMNRYTNLSFGNDSEMTDTFALGLGVTEMFFLLVINL